MNLDFVYLYPLKIHITPKISFEIKKYTPFKSIQ